MAPKQRPNPKPAAGGRKGPPGPPPPAADQDGAPPVAPLFAALLPPATREQADRVEAWLAGQLAALPPHIAAERSAALAIALARALRIQGTSDEVGGLATVAAVAAVVARLLAARLPRFRWSVPGGGPGHPSA